MAILRNFIIRISLVFGSPQLHFVLKYDVNSGAYCIWQEVVQDEGFYIQDVNLQQFVFYPGNFVFYSYSLIIYRSMYNTNGTKNLTTINAMYNGQLTWIACETSLAIMTIILIYICICLAYSVCQEGGPSAYARAGNRNTSVSETNRCDNLHRSCRGDRNFSISKTKKRLRTAMRWASLFSGVSTLLKLLVDQLKFFYAWNAQSDTVCEAVYDATDVIIFYFAYMSVYAFLWIKQWLFYCDPLAAKMLYSKTLVIFSKVFVCLVFLSSLVVAFLNYIPVRFKVSTVRNMKDAASDPSYLGCVSVYDMREPSTRLPLILYCALNAIFQSTLMGLFVYPLIWHRLKKWKLKQRCHAVKDTSACGSSRNAAIALVPAERNTGAFGRRHQSVSSRVLSKNAVESIQRTACWTAVCIFTDATLVVTFAVLNVGTPMILTAVASDIVLLTNVLCIVATYRNWRSILFPFCNKKTDPDEFAPASTNRNPIRMSTLKGGVSNAN